MKFSLRNIVFFVLISMTLLSGCISTGPDYKTDTLGPTANKYDERLKRVTPTYKPHETLYLDVAVPVIDPGFPLSYGSIDHEALAREDIWPEVRRLEAKRFSVNIRDALSNTKAFGAVRVVPGIGTSADLYIIGRINKSKGTDTRLGITVVDATGKTWGDKNFSLALSSDFYKSETNIHSDPNHPIYSDIARWVYTLLYQTRTEELKHIQLVRHMLYAKTYSPEAFTQYLTEKRGVFSVNALPADNDALLQRILTYQAQDMAFLDSLQEQYDLLYLQTNKPYRQYQEESILIGEQVVKENEQFWKAIMGSVICSGIGIAAANQRTHLGDAIASGCATGAAVGVKNAIGSYQAIEEFKTVFNEVGQSIDLQVSPQVREFEEREVALVGSAYEQYQQWRNHLLKIYREMETPDINL